MNVRLVALLMAMVGIAQAADDGGDLQELGSFFERDTLVLVASEHGCHHLDIFVAQNQAQRARGLMHVRALPDRTGMLFVYERDALLSMWMKNTYIPLDMVFARADGSVSSIAYDTEPQSLQSVAALEPVRYVLELNAGMAERLSVDQYSRLLWDGMAAQ